MWTGAYFSAINVILAVCLVVGGQAAGADPKPAGKVVLDTESMWRMRLVWETEEVLLKSGKVEHVVLKFRSSYSKLWKDGPTTEDFDVERVPMVREPAQTPVDWMKPDFDDSTWAYGQGPLLSGGTRRERFDAVKGVGWKLLLLRGRFDVTDPRRAEGLTLSVEYKGGIVVYLNGEELTRDHMPEGKIEAHTPALPYEKETWLRPDGYVMGRRDYAAYEKKHASDPTRPRRIRKLAGFKIPAEKLRKGGNVLAVAIHRPPAPWRYYVTRNKATPRGVGWGSGCVPPFPRLGFHSIELTAPPEAAGVSPSAGGAASGLKAWNYSIARRVFTSFYKHAPAEQLRPIRIMGCRNGVFSGQVVLGCANAIRGLKVQVSDLKGPGQVPAKAVDVRYAQPNGWVEQGWMSSLKGPWFDGLEEDAPAEVPVFKDGGGAVQPVWFKVTVPKDAKPGDYKAAVKISADGLEPVRAEIALKVADWALPEPKDFITDMDYFQSPDTVAMK